MKVTKLIVSTLCLAATSALAGTASISAGKGKTVAPGPQPVAASTGITGTATVGYDSGYYFRGLWFSNNNIYGGLNLSIPVADKLSVGLGALYTYSLDSNVPGGNLDYSELDLMGSLNYDAGFAKFGLVATNYQFFQTFSGEVNGKTFGYDNAPDSTLKHATDLGLTVAVPVGAATLYGSAFYDFTVKAVYAEVGVDYTIKVSDSLSIVPAVQVGYAASEYYTLKSVTGVDSGWTHVRAGISAPYKVCSNCTITPYVAANFALEAREKLNLVEDQNDIFGGVSVSYSF